MSSSLRSNPWRAYQCLARQRVRIPQNTRHLSSTTLRSANNAASNPLRSAERAKRVQEVAKAKRSVVISTVGIIACAATMYGLITYDVFGVEALKNKEEATLDKQADAATSTPTNNGAIKMDGPTGFPSDGGPPVIPVHGQDLVDQIATGNSSVPYFPTTIRLPSLKDDKKQAGDELSTADGDEYQLLGLGIRSVSFLSIQVYVVGLYVAKADITELQQRLVHTAVHPPSNDAAAISGVGADAATSLVPPERQQLKEMLLDPETGDAAWSAIIKDDGIRTAFRIVPTRNTDFMHLRDGWVRGITARAQQKKPAPGSEQPGEFQDQEFGTSMNDFKAVFGGGQRKNVPKGQTLVLMRGAQGALDALFQPEASKPIQWMGRVSDERISRLVWLNYLAGKTVASDGARRNIVDGLMTVVERPVGTVTQRVV